MEIDRSRVLAFRLANQQLSRRGGLEPAAATAPQNTPPGSALLALRVRSDVSAAQVASALEEERTLVQVWSLRGSPCVVPSAELALFTVGLLPDDEESWRAVVQGFVPMIDEMGLTATETMGLVIEATRDALDGKVLTKRELGVALGKRLPKSFAKWMEPDAFSSFAAILTRAASLTGEFVIAPRVGNEASFLRTDQWLAPAPAGRDARADIVRRYLRLYGPSTPDDFASWSGIAPAYAKGSWEMVASELSEVSYEGRRQFVLSGDKRRLASAKPARGIRLLPPYEPWLQQRDRATVVPDKSLHKRIWKATGNPGVVLLNGEVVALWRQKKNGRVLQLTVEDLGDVVDLDPIRTEAEPYAAFRGCSKTVVTKATKRPT